jgi:hypothetical protein
VFEFDPFNVGLLERILRVFFSPFCSLISLAYESKVSSCSLSSISSDYLDMFSLLESGFASAESSSPMGSSSFMMLFSIY